LHPAARVVVALLERGEGVSGGAAEAEFLAEVRPVDLEGSGALGRRKLAVWVQAGGVCCPGRLRGPDGTSEVQCNFPYTETMIVEGIRTVAAIVNACRGVVEPYETCRKELSLSMLRTSKLTENRLGTNMSRDEELLPYQLVLQS